MAKAKNLPRFDDQVVWITGASSGIGAALVQQFAKTGAKLILSARREDELRMVRIQAGIPEDRAALLPLDLAAADTLGPATQLAIDTFGRVDVLINNAGIGQRSKVLDTNMDVYRRLMEVNYFGTIALTKALLPHLVQRRSGHIAVVTSVAGKYGVPMRSGYSASKFALHGFFEALRAEVHAHNILVTMVAPGFVKTNISVNALVGDGSSQGKMDDGQANGLDPLDVARDIIYAISEGRNEFIPAGRKERLAYFLSRFAPNVLARFLRNAKVT